MKIALLGYGKEGQAAENYFKTHFNAECDIFENFTYDEIKQRDYSSYDIILRSPSVPPLYLTNESSLTKYFFDHCPCPIIGVTATKGKGNDYATGQSKKSVGSLRRIMALEGQTNLHNTPAKQNEANSSDQSENEIAQIVDDRDRVAVRSKGRYAKCSQKSEGDHQHRIEAKTLFYLSGDHRLILVFLVHFAFPPFSC